MCKRKALAILCIMALVMANNSVIAMANQSNSNTVATITITDPETGQVWITELTESDVQIQPTSRGFSNDGSVEETKMVSIDAAKYIGETLPQSRTNVNTSFTDGMTIKTGMTYSFNGSNVQITAISGSTESSGLYYATD